VVLAKYLDDHTFASLNSLIFFNHVEIVNRLQADNQFLDELFHRLFAPDVELSTLRDLVAFMQELCSLAKNLQMLSRSAFYKSLKERRIFALLETHLAHRDLSVRLSIIDIINGLLAHESSICRSVMMEQDPKCRLFGVLVDQLFADNDAGMKSQLAEVLRMLLDPELMEGASEKDDFLNIFYEEYMNRLVSCISSGQAVKDKMVQHNANSTLQLESDETLVAHTQNQAIHLPCASAFLAAGHITYHGTRFAKFLPSVCSRMVTGSSISYCGTMWFKRPCGMCLRLARPPI
jgi:protein phosphatase-4 regulatory subunit 3